MKCSCGNPVYVNEKGFAGRKPYVSKYCARCLADKFSALFEDAEKQADNVFSRPECIYQYCPYSDKGLCLDKNGGCLHVAPPA